MNRILAQRGRLTTEEKSSWWTLGATWMQELTKTLTDGEREALAQALAMLLDRSDLAVCTSEGLDR
jgi:uncharacterized membrane protein YgcG